MIEDTFNVLYDNWYRETLMEQDWAKVRLNIHYQQIIGLGTPALPYIFKALLDGESRMSWALRCIARENPAENIDSGKRSAIRMAWIDWGFKNKHITEEEWLKATAINVETQV